MENEFRECATCAAEPGSPTLCPSCAHNREVITRLSGQAKEPGPTAKIVIEVEIDGDATEKEVLYVIRGLRILGMKVGSITHGLPSVGDPSDDMDGVPGVEP